MDIVYFLFAAYIELTVSEIYGGKFLQFVLQSDSGLYSNGRSNV